MIETLNFLLVEHFISIKLCTIDRKDSQSIKHFYCSPFVVLDSVWLRSVMVRKMCR